MAQRLPKHTRDALPNQDEEVTQGTTPWVIAGNGTAGVADPGVVTIQGIAGGVPIPISGTITVSASGLATEAKQDTQITILNSIDGKTPALGQALAAASVPVVLTALQLTTLTPPPAITNYALEAGGHLASVDTGVTSIDSKTPALGQALAASSVPVVLTAAQVVTLTPPPAITGFALEAGHLATIDSTLTTINSKVPVLGQALAASSVPVVLTAAQLAILTPPAAITNYALETGGHLATVDTSTAAINTKTPALGQALAAASVPVVLTAAQLITLTPPAAITGFALEAGHLATIDTSTAAINSKVPALGQALAAASVPVVLTAAQLTTLTPPAAITGFALEAGHLATIDTSTAAIDSKTPALGQALAAASVPVVLTAAQLAALTPLASVAAVVTNAGTFAVQDSQVIADNNPFTDGTSKVFVAGFIFDEVAGTALTENDAAAARVDAKRSVVMVLEDATTRGQRAAVSAAGAVKVDGSAVTQPVSGAVTAVVTNAGTFAVQDSQVIADNNPFTDGTSKVFVAGFIFDEVAGTALTENDAAAARVDAKRAVVGVIEDATTRGQRAKVSAAGAITVEGTVAVSTAVVTNAGSFAVQDSQVIADNNPFTDGTSKVFVAGFIFDEVAGTALTENDAAAARVDAKRAVVGVIEDATTRGQRAAVSAAGAVKVDGSAVTQPVSGTVTSAPTVPTNATSTAYEASRVVKASAGTLFAITGYNSRTSAQFIQVHDAAALPANGAAPVVIFTVPAASNFAFELYRGRAMATGIVVCNSSTGPTKTLGSADCWFDVQYT